MASAYLTRTVTASTATSYTVSFWVKINDVGNTNTPYFWSIGSSAGNGIYFDSDAKIDFFKQSTASYLTLYDGVLRDPSAWYHIVWSVNSGTGTAYVNGVTGNSHSSIPALNDNTGTKINIHSYVTGAYNTLDCCMAHFHFIDGTAYPASTFGETDSTSGIWKPKTAPSVTYGTNGFFLKFENSGAMGTDSSGNGNNFTVSGTLTQNVDTPANVFATLNPLQQNNTATTYSNGNTKGTGTSSTSNFSSTPATLAASVGKWYAEYKPNLSSTDSSISGFVNLDTANFNATDYYGGSNNMSAGLYDSGGQILYSTGTNLGSVGALSNGDIVMLAMDLDNGYLYWGKNGTWFNSANPATSGGTGGLALSNLGSNGTYTFLNGNRKSMGTEWNFGSGFFGTTAVASANADANGFGAFEYTVPSGYYALCTKNIKEFG